MSRDNKTISIADAKKKRKETPLPPHEENMEAMDEEYEEEQEEAQYQEFLWCSLEDSPVGEILVNMSVKASDVEYDPKKRNLLLTKYGFDKRTATAFDLQLCQTANNMAAEGQHVDICDLRAAVLDDRFLSLFQVLQTLEFASDMLLGFDGPYDGAEYEEE